MSFSSIANNVLPNGFSEGIVDRECSYCTADLRICLRLCMFFSYALAQF